MEKIKMRDWVASLEGIIDNKLNKWLKHPRIENGESVLLFWQFELTLMVLYVSWQDEKELVKFRYLSPRIGHEHEWPGLDERTFNNVQDRMGNYAQMAMYRTRDHEING